MEGKLEDVRLSKDLQIHGCVVRLAPVVHGSEDKGFISRFDDIANKNGSVANAEPEIFA